MKTTTTFKAKKLHIKDIYRDRWFMMDMGQSKYWRRSLRWGEVSEFKRIEKVKTKLRDQFSSTK